MMETNILKVIRPSLSLSLYSVWHFVMEFLLFAHR